MDLRRSQRIFYGLICLHVLSYSVFLMLSRNNAGTTPNWGILFTLSAVVISLVAVFNTYWHSSWRVKNFWLLTSGGLLFSLAGLLVWAYRGLILGNITALTGVPQLLLGCGLILELGAFAYLFSRQDSWTKFGFGLEIFIAMMVGITLSWHFVIQPALSQATVSGLDLVSFLSYSLLDLGLLLVALAIIYAPRRILPGSVWPWLLFHLLILLGGNSAFLYFGPHDPQYAWSFSQPWWALAYLGLVPAALNYLGNNMDMVPRDELDLASIGDDGSDYLRLLLPYACLALLVVIMFSSDQNINSLEVLGAGLLLAVVFSQTYTLNGHNSMLDQILRQTGELELQAQSRAEELHQKNTQLQTALEDIQHLAYYDVLTNLPNRRFFMNKLTESLVRANQNNHMLAVLFIDLDSFKLINDTMGHSFGDLLLKDIGEKIMNSIRNTDTVSRQGGDEFAVLLDQIASIEEAKRWIEEIQMRIQDAFVINEIEVHVAASIGVALYPRHGDDSDNLIKYSDIALFKAKELGKNQYAIYTADMNQVFMRRMSLDKELRSAIRNEELCLYYQPQLNVASGEIMGVEALVRWNSMILGDVSPSEMIPVAEENGHIMQIGGWVLTTACRQVKTWLDKGYNIPKVAVNMSPVQFNDDKLVASIQRVLQETGLEPQYLELEITEGTAMFNERAVINKIHALKELGINVALDDFGTGYSCLAYLSQFPVDTLKIDRSFISNITNNRDNAVLVETIIGMAHNFNINVIAEGVDTFEQFQMLREKKCDEIQGYLISEPLHSEQLIHLINKYRYKPDSIRAIS